MYKLSTYFYWLIILDIRKNLFLLYWILRIFRYPVLKIVEYLLYRKCAVKVVYLDKTACITKHADQDVALRDELSVIKLYVKNKNLILRIITEGSMAVGEGLMNEEIYCHSIEELTLRILEGFGSRANPLFKLRDWVYLNATEFPWDDNGSRNGSKANWLQQEKREILRKIMGNNYNFVSGCWDSENMTIDSAITRNMELISKKLDLTHGMSILDIGCGTGEFAKYLAKNYDGINVTGINLSKEEIEIGKSSTVSNEAVQLIAGDYKSLLSDHIGKFDRVISIHLIEHLGGPKEYDSYFDTLQKYLKPGGKCFIQVIVLLKPIPLRVDLFGRKHLLANQVTPYGIEIFNGINKRNLSIETLESFAMNYRKTFLQYLEQLNEFQNVGANSNNIYLRAFEIALRILNVLLQFKRIDVWQILVSKEYNS